MDSTPGKAPNGAPNTGRRPRRGTRQVGRERYLRRIEAFAERIRCAGEVGEIAKLLNEALHETRGLRVRAGRARTGVVNAEREIAALRAELELSNALLREDRVTGVLNARGLAAAFEREAARATRLDSALSLLLIEIDGYGTIGAALGGAGSDQALTHFADLAGSALRSSDHLARCGGGRFAALLPEARLADARLCALRIQAALALEPAAWNGAAIAVTFSAGAVQRRHGESLDEALARALGGLESAQRAGANRIKTVD